MEIVIKPIRLSDKQREIAKSVLNPNVKLIAACTGRQVGKTELAIHLILHWLFNEKNRLPTGFILPTYKQCRKVLSDIQSRLKGIIHVQFNKTELIIYNVLNDNKVIFLSGESGDSIRGYTFKNLIIDEACFIQSNTYQQVIAPTIGRSLTNNTGKLVLLSTPKAKNWFYDMIVNPPFKNEECYITRFTSEEGGLISKEILNSYRKNTPEQVFMNEYMGEFVEEGTGLFKYKSSLLDDSVLNMQRNKVISAKEGVFAGVDWGVEDDYTVLTILDKDGHLIEVHKWKQIEWNTIIQNIVNVVSKYRCTVYAETNGIGNMPFKELKNRYSNTLAFTTTNKSKNDIIQKLIMDFEKGEIKIPNRNDLLVELDSFELNVTNHGNITYGARQGFHDDMLMSLAIANHKRVKSTFSIGTK